MSPVTTQIAIVAILATAAVIVNGGPLADATNSAQDREAFAQNLRECVEEKRSKYSQATQTFSGEGITNESVNECLKEAIEDLRPYMSTGIPSLGLKSTDPLKVKDTDIIRDVPPINIQTKLTNVVAKGLSKFKTRKVNADLRNKSIQIVITVPNLYLEGNYVTNSQLAIIRIKGNGPFTANITKLTGDASMDIKIVEKTMGNKAGQKILMVENVSFGINIAKASIKLENLFPGQKALSATADKFLNSKEFSKMMQREIKPQIIEEVNKYFEKVMNIAFSQFPVNNYLDQLGYTD